jgi:DNA-binding NarL/FixJ family response regulator
LVHDHRLFLDGLRPLVEEAGFVVIGEAVRGEEAVLRARALGADVVVVDEELPDLSGLEVARLLNRQVPGAGIVLLTVRREEAFVLEALRAGVTGYVLKSQASGDLLHAIREVRGGALYLSPQISRTLGETTPDRLRVADPLTAREREVLRLIAESHTTREIASNLGISVKTAECHRTNIMKKLDLHDTAGLVRYAIRRGLVRA